MAAKKQSAVIVPASTVDWRRIAERVGLIGATLAASSVIWNYLTPILDSGPLPVPSRAEVKAIAKKLSEDERLTSEIQAKTVSRLDELQQANQAVLQQQRTQLRDTLANRLRSLQAAIDQAKAINDKDPTIANQKVLEALNTQLTELNRQIMDMSSQTP